MKTTTRDELVGILEAGYKAIICEAGEWRPLANHIFAWIEMAQRGEIRVVEKDGQRVIENVVEEA